VQSVWNRRYIYKIAGSARMATREASVMVTVTEIGAEMTLALCNWLMVKLRNSFVS